MKKYIVVILALVVGNTVQAENIKGEHDRAVRARAAAKLTACLEGDLTACECKSLDEARAKREYAVSRANSNYRSKVFRCEQSGARATLRMAIVDKDWMTAAWLINSNLIEVKGAQYVNADCENNQSVVAALDLVEISVNKLAQVEQKLVEAQCD